LLAANSAY